MPDMDGPTLVQTIRGMKNAIPIIMVSGSVDARELGEKAGIDRFVEKNRLNAELGEAIHTCLAGH
jgi:CheY-like chemotaxis protein